MSRRVLNTRNVIFFVGISFLIAFYLGFFRHSLEFKLIGGADYFAQYSAGYMIRYGDANRIYEVDYQKAIQSRFISLEKSSRFYPYNHPPLLAGILSLITSEHYYASYFRWLLVLLAFHLVALTLLVRIVRQYGWQLSDLMVLGVSGLLFYPAMLAYLKGQDSTFLLMGICLWVFGILTASDPIAGAGLALALIRPQVVLFLVIPFVFKRRKVLWWFLLFALVVILYCYLLVGVKGMTDYFRMLVFSGQGLGFDVDKMITLMGAILRLIPHIEPNVLHVIGYGGYALGVIFLCMLWAVSRNLEFKHVGLAILLCMFFAPHMHNHDLVLFMIPTLGAATTLCKTGVLPPHWAALLPLGASLVLLAKDVSSIHTVSYVLMLLLALSLWAPLWLMPRRKKELTSTPA